MASENGKTTILKALRHIAWDMDYSRVQLSEALDISPAAVTKLIAPLIEEGIIYESSFRSGNRNRKGRYLKLTENHYRILAIRISRTDITASIADSSGRIIREDKLESFSDIISYASASMFDAAVIITPGSPMNTMDAAPFGWRFEGIKNWFTDEMHVPFSVCNDSNARLFGEMWFGAGRGHDDDSIVLYNIGRGIGAAAYVNGQLIKGYSGSAVEIGHVTVDMNGGECSCGNRGCLELYASLDKWPDLYDEGVLREYSETLALGAEILAASFSPSLMIMAANDAPDLDFSRIIPYIRKYLEKHFFPMKLNELQIVPSALGDYGFLLGAIPVALHELL